MTRSAGCPACQYLSGTEDNWEGRGDNYSYPFPHHPITSKPHLLLTEKYCLACPAVGECACSAAARVAEGVHNSNRIAIAFPKH